MYQQRVSAAHLPRRLFGKRTRTLLPTAVPELLKPKIPQNTRDKILRRKEIQTSYYDRGSKDLPRLAKGDAVHMAPKPNDRSHRWTRAQVEDQVDVRSYAVRTEDGRIYRRNRRHLRKSHEPYTRVVTDHTPTDVPLPPATEIEENSSDSAPQRPEDAATTPNPLHQNNKCTPPTEPVQGQEEHMPPAKPGTTRSGRTVKTPSHLSDYVLNK